MFGGLERTPLAGASGFFRVIVAFRFAKGGLLAQPMATIGRPFARQILNRAPQPDPRSLVSVAPRAKVVGDDRVDQQLSDVVCDHR